MSRVYMTVRDNHLYIDDNRIDYDNYEGENTLLHIYCPIRDSDSVTVELEDGATFYISKRAHLERKEHQYWQFFTIVPPQWYCTMEFAGLKHSDEVWSEAHLKRVVVNEEDIIPYKE